MEQKQNNHGQGIRTCNPKVAATSGISKGEGPWLPKKGDKIRGFPLKFQVVLY